MPKKSVVLSRDDFLLYLHLTQSEAAEHHGVSLSCYKRKFHQMFRPRIYWSTKKDRIILRKAIDYPKNNRLTQELVDQFLNGTLRSQIHEESSQTSEEQKLIREKDEFSLSMTLLMQQYRENQQKLHSLYCHFSQHCTESKVLYLGYPELLEGPWREEIDSFGNCVEASALIVLNDDWDIVAANDSFGVMFAYTPSELLSGVSWASLLPSSLEKTFLNNLFTSVVTVSLHATWPLVSKTGAIIHSRIRAHKYSNGYYIFIEEIHTKSETCVLNINQKNEYVLPGMNNVLMEHQGYLCDQLQILLNYVARDQYEIDNHLDSSHRLGVDRFDYGTQHHHSDAGHMFDVGQLFHMDDISF